MTLLRHKITNNQHGGNKDSRIGTSHNKTLYKDNSINSKIVIIIIAAATTSTITSTMCTSKSHYVDRLHYFHSIKLKFPATCLVKNDVGVVLYPRLC